MKQDSGANFKEHFLKFSDQHSHNYFRGFPFAFPPSLLNSDSRFHRVYFRPEKNRIFQRHLTDVCQGNQLLYLVIVHRDSTNITLSKYCFATKNNLRFHAA